MLGSPLGFDDYFKDNKFLQDKFIASLELPTYNIFVHYQFLDVLDALSFRLMVMDHLNNLEESMRKMHEESLRPTKAVAEPDGGNLIAKGGQ